MFAALVAMHSPQAREAAGRPVGLVRRADDSPEHGGLAQPEVLKGHLMLMHTHCTTIRVIGAVVFEDSP